MAILQHPDAQALYRAIVHAPLDDAPRLILADWLDENGEPERAEYLRLACAIDRAKFADSTFALRRRRDELWEQFTGRLWDELPSFIPAVYWGIGQHPRGFCQAVRLPNLRTFRDCLPRIAALAPVIDFQFTGKESLLPLAAMPELGSIHYLNISFNREGCTDAAVTALVRSPHLRTLLGLGCGSTSITDVALEILADSPASTSLRTLDLFINELGTGLGTLARTRHFGALEEINLHSIQGTSDDWERFVHAPAFRTLRRLRFGPPFGAVGVHALAQSPLLAQLKHLAIVRNTDGAACVQAFVAGACQNLRELEIIGRITDVGAEAIAHCEGLRGLQALAISSGRLTENGCLALLHSPFLTNLRQLSIETNPITDRVVRAILEQPRWCDLEILTIDRDQTMVSPHLLAELDHVFGSRLRNQDRGLYR